MSKITGTISEIHSLEEQAQQSTPLTTLHPLAKLLMTMAYIVTLMSLGKYNLPGTLFMASYPLLGFHLGHLAWREGLWRLRLILPLVACVGIANPFFDKHIIYWGDFIIRAGYLSFFSLLLKGVLAVLASYLLIATTTIEQICYALRLLQLPKLLVTQLLLSYRYLTLLLEQADTIAQAYALRAPKQKGVHFKVWGSLAGQLLLRSIDRANNLYDSMLLRGYQGEYYYGGPLPSWGRRDWLYLLGLVSTLLAVALLPGERLLGQLMSFLG